MTPTYKIWDHLCKPTLRNLLLFQIIVKCKPKKCIYTSKIDGNKLKNTLKVIVVLILAKKNQITL
jgi:hypothetical protein